jgi:hypothetical protein
MFIPTWGILPPDTAFSLPHKSSGNFSRALVLAWEPVPEWAPARPALFAAQVWRQAVAR